jgi:ribonuclease G
MPQYTAHQNQRIFGERSLKSLLAKKPPQAIPNQGTNIIINSEPWEVRVALIENGRLSELNVERVADRTPVGNIYKGRVVRVLPGMQAAFVDIGLERTAFLYVAEIHEEFNHLIDELPTTPTNEEELDEIEELASIRAVKVKSNKIQDMIREGQEVLVQVSKAPIGTKGARLTCYMSLPGRHMVLMPNVDQIGISRRIGTDQERRRLRDIMSRIKKRGEGIIARTACEGQSEEALTEDARYLRNLWQDIQTKAEKVRAPALVYSEINIALRAVRDLSTEHVKKIYVDDPVTYQEVVEFIRIFIPKRRNLVEPYKGEKPIFDHFQLEAAINRAMEKKVWLKSGGYLIIEQAEALVAIDVNTGRYVGDKNFDDTILKTNLEAVDEIVHQLRFRNMGGIIILDFIDMDRAAHREKVFRALEDALKADKARTKISKITSLGLVEMTRKRTQENIGIALTEPCSYCEGAGRLKSRISICYEIFRALQREAISLQGKEVYVNAHPDVVKLLTGEERPNLSILEERLNKSIHINKDAKLHIEDFEIHA